MDAPISGTGQVDSVHWMGISSGWVTRATTSLNARLPSINGVVVEVHKSENGDTLWSRVGQFRPDGTGIGDSQRFDSGSCPRCDSCARSSAGDSQEPE